MAAIPVVGLSLMRLRVIGCDLRSIVVTAGKHRPGNACQFVGQGGCQKIAVGKALCGTLDPWP